MLIRPQQAFPLARNNRKLFLFFLFFILLLNSVYTVLPLSQGLDRVEGGTIHMITVKYVHTKLCLSVLSVYTEYYLHLVTNLVVYSIVLRDHQHRIIRGGLQFSF